VFFSNQRSRNAWIVVVSLLTISIFALLSAIARIGIDLEGSELAPGESETVRAEVLRVVEEGLVDLGEFEQPYQLLRLRLLEGPLRDQEVEVEHGLLGLTNQSRIFRAHDRVLVEHTRSLDGGHLFFITDYVRARPLLWLALLFVGATVLLSRWQGVRSLVAMAVSVLVIVAFVVPQILAGRNPAFIAIAGSIVMMGFSLYLVYGWNRKSHAAVAGLFLGLVLTGFLARWFVDWARLSGYGAEEVGFLQIAGMQLDLQGLLLAGIVIGSLGVLDDIAVGQSSAVFELNKANPGLGWRDLYGHAMVIGRDHVAAMVNTLLLAYAGAALPLLLLFSVGSEPLALTLNREIIAEEIVRTLVGSLGLLGSVPLTSLIAALMARSGSRVREGSSFPADKETP
jgi:uncharacterized membrane protein